MVYIKDLSRHRSINKIHCTKDVKSQSNNVLKLLLFIALIVEKNYLVAHETVVNFIKQVFRRKNPVIEIVKLTRRGGGAAGCQKGIPFVRITSPKVFKMGSFLVFQINCA